MDFNHWETIRDCDYVEAKIRGDEDLWQKVYFGTPYESFRRRLMKETGKKAPDSPFYLWKTGEVKQQLDLTNPRELPPGKLASLLSALASDFYRPQRVTSLFTAIFPDEYFNPLTSPTRVHQLLRRLRLCLKNHKSKLAIKEENHLYQLDVEHCAVRVTLPGVSAPDRLEKLRDHFQKSHFTSKDVTELFKISSSTAIRLLDDGLRDGSLTTDGKGRATRYRFAA